MGVDASFGWLPDVDLIAGRVSHHFFRIEVKASFVDFWQSGWVASDHQRFSVVESVHELVGVEGRNERFEEVRRGDFVQVCLV